MTQLMFFWSISLPFGLGFLIIFWPIGVRDRRRLAWPSLILAAIGSLVAIGWAVFFWNYPSNTGTILFNGPQLGNGLPSLQWELSVDPLAALFLLLIGCGSLIVSIYSFSYLGLVPIGTGKSEKDAHGIAAAYSLFVGSMLFVIAANNVFPLLICLEVMSLAFGYLVLFRHNKGRDTAGIHWLSGDRRTRKLAIQAYLISSHVSLVLFTAALLIRGAQVGDLSFDAFRHFRTTADPLTFWLAFVGLAIRAGVVPFHIWVPLAHPSSPTNTHALSLGVAIKVPIYLMILVFFSLLGPITGWWGLVVLLFGALTAVVGIFYAMASRDLKTALSYSSIENVGIILVSVGLALTLASTDLRSMPGMLGLAGLALVAGLFQVVNHTVFKGLLYLSTGAIERLAGTVEYRWLGGLFKKFPWTASAFLFGAIAIAGFPPFNGFISEWLTLQSLFAALNAFAIPGLVLSACAVIIATALLALTFGLTAFAFVKMAGITILGKPRKDLIITQQEIPWFIRLIFIVLSVICLLFGILPWPILALLSQVTQSLGLPALALQGRGNAIIVNSRAVLRGAIYTSLLSSEWLWLLTIAFVVLIVSVVLQQRTKHKEFLKTPRVAWTKMPLPAWTSGIPYDNTHMQATDAYFSYQIDVPLRREREDPSLQHASENVPIIPKGVPISDHYQVMEFFQQWYNSGLASFQHFATWITLKIQNGRIRIYVAYTVITLIGLLITWVVWGGR
jgi:hydrogenase-4 component B